LAALHYLFAAIPDGSRLGASLGACQLPVDFGGRLLAMPAVGPDDRLPGRVGDSSIGKEPSHSQRQVVYENVESDIVGRRWCRQAVDHTVDSKVDWSVA